MKNHQINRGPDLRVVRNEKLFFFIFELFRNNLKRISKLFLTCLARWDGIFWDNSCKRAGLKPPGVGDDVWLE